MQSITEPGQPRGSAWLALGFRPFFLAAALAALVLMGMWLALRGVAAWSPDLLFSPSVWHGHELVFGYGLAVVAGFLLTAVHNWTGQPTLAGWPLAVLAGMWLLARVGWLWPSAIPLAVTAVFDLLFGVWLVLALWLPVQRARQWQQLGVLAKVLLLVLANGWLYLAAWTDVSGGLQQGLYLGFYALLALVITMGRRVIPFFIEKGVGCPFQARNRRWLDVTSLVLYLGFMVFAVFLPAAPVAALLAAVLAVLHAVRLSGWYTPAVWSRPLLWVLVLGYGWVAVGFGLYAASYWLPLSPFPALHAFAVGAIGLISLGMMARVTLGHTGRDVLTPPTGLGWLFGLLAAAAVVRVMGPLALPAHAGAWLVAAQVLWLLAFGGFIWRFAPSLWQPRVDGRPG